MVPEDARGRGNVSVGGSSPLVFSGVFLPSPRPPAFAALGVRWWGEKFSSMCCGANGTEPPALSLKLKLVSDDRGERQGWLEPPRFAAPFPAPRGWLARVWVCWEGAVPLQTPR